VARSNRLHSLAQDLPGSFNVGSDADRVGGYLLESAAQCAPCDQRVPECDTRFRSTVESVRSRCNGTPATFLRNVSTGRGDPEIALGILKVDRIHLVGHGRGAHLAGYRALAQVTERNIPHTSRLKSISTTFSAATASQYSAIPVVRLDLRGVASCIAAAAIPRSCG